MATAAGNKFDSTPTESFSPQIKYDSSNALPATLITQNNRGITGRRCLRVAITCTTQRPANRNTPRYPMIFHGVSTTPNAVLMTSFILSFLANGEPGLVPAPQPHHAADVDDADP